MCKSAPQDQDELRDPQCVAGNRDKKNLGECTGCVVMQYKSKCGRNVGFVGECGEGRQVMARVQRLERTIEALCSRRAWIYKCFKADLPEFIIAAALAAAPVCSCRSQRPQTMAPWEKVKSHAALR